MAQILKSQGQDNKKMTERAKRAYIAPQLVRISKVVSETRYDRDLAKHLNSVPPQ